MKPIWVVIVLAFSSGHFLFSQNNFSASGEQHGFWQYDTVFVTSDVIVPHLEELHIAAGTKIIFQGHYSMHIQGSIKAIGQEGDSIVFTVADTSGFHTIYNNDGGWNGLRFEDTSLDNDSSLFEYCVFSYGKAVGDSANCYGGAIRVISSGNIAMRHSRLTNNYAYYWGGAMYAYKTNMIVEHCAVENNYAGNEGLIYGYGGGLCFVSSEPELRFVYFKRNSSTGIGGAVSFEYSNPLLINAVFEENHSGLGGAIGFLRSKPERAIANLLIANNTALFFGGGIANITASPKMSNLTIVNNQASMGGGYYCNELAHPVLYNSILWGNQSDSPFGSQVWIWDIVSVPEFYYCAVQLGVEGFGGSSFIGIYENCTEENPGFTDEADKDYTLTKNGSCYNAGINYLPFYTLPHYDLSMNHRIQFDTIDLGAYEIQESVGISTFQREAFTAKLYPNPINSDSKLTVNNHKLITAIELINPYAAILQRQAFSAISQKNDYLIMSLFPELGQLPHGWYLLRITYSDGSNSLLKLIK
ncbi:MAG: T9SS type A sorting domain-containing protein [Bacteroidales bacterium]|jgi:hypothetical protein|nr:T9SS type A sorting domain-containing protein [Bacteroidales bacterium]MDY0369699.1 T9SS type A sorting domain-containing protein [Bacteroidales bacterium]